MYYLSILLLLVSATAFVPPSARAQISGVPKLEGELCNSNQVDSTTMSASLPKWFQKEISITAPSRGCHLITSEVNKVCSYFHQPEYDTYILDKISYPSHILLYYYHISITTISLLLPYLYYYHIRLFKKTCQRLRLVWQISLSSIHLLHLQSTKMRILMWYVFLDNTMHIFMHVYDLI